jgi:hypothetical protein
MLREGIHYDETGEYTRECLEKGPSFACEVDGEVVSCSCTHLSGSMGMIYTPQQHRRKGYGNSLAAFQVDYMLAHIGPAFCHVNIHNEASYGNSQMTSGLSDNLLCDQIASSGCSCYFACCKIFNGSHACEKGSLSFAHGILSLTRDSLPASNSLEAACISAITDWAIFVHCQVADFASGPACSTVNMT